ncbi:hypothetical protein GCM10022403_074060 [Streptomyces coacervatus]|uniref:Uncharacterized protein n=1 Tax=Streptomyces coacervatus TaxID=647381 RepID=A0ABP7IY39_9ACTN|nr:hypothetical protein [Streptomyces coacervatus]MDF2270156.1 hypothetical protein [Streptomyces coacervatus]
MKFFIIAVSIAFLCAAYAWPVIPLLVYPLNRRRGFWAALYCCAVAVFFGLGFRYTNRFMVSDFFEAAVYTSAVRAIAEATGILEKPRQIWRKREHEQEILS